jgi:hypothetical protein
MTERRRSRDGEIPRPGSRRYQDAQGVWWRVYERPGGRGGSCLIFESDTAARRVTDYPAEWAQLPNDALEKLSWKR